MKLELERPSDPAHGDFATNAALRAAASQRRPPPADGYQGDYVALLAAQAGDPVPAMLKQIRKTLHRFRVDFDSYTREADLADEVAPAMARIDTYESEGTLWARTTAQGDDKDR